MEYLGIPEKAPAPAKRVKAAEKRARKSQSEQKINMLLTAAKSVGMNPAIVGSAIEASTRRISVDEID